MTVVRRRLEAAEELDDRSREYTSAMRVTADSPLDGMTVEEAKEFGIIDEIVVTRPKSDDDNGDKDSDDS